MRAESPAALRFILQEDIYLLQSESNSFQAAMAETAAAAPIEAAIAPPEIKKQEPVTQIPVLAPVKETPAPAYNYHGGNKKSFLILTHYLKEDFIAAEHLAALQNILKRKEYELEDVAILNVAKTADASIIDLVGYFKPEKLLILGAAAVPSGMAVPPLNQPKKMKNGVLLHSFSFDEMFDSTDNKKAFWDQMKNL